MAVVDSGATKNFCSDSYVRDKHLTTHPLVNPLRIRLADGSMSMARFGVNIEFNIGALKITQEFIMTRLSGQHQIILGYEFLEEFNPQIDWTMETLNLARNFALATSALIKSMRKYLLKLLNSTFLQT